METDSTSLNEQDEWDELQITDADALSTVSDLHDCWQCNNCSKINNVYLTIQQKEFFCAFCEKEKFIPGETKIIQKVTYDKKDQYKVANPTEQKLLKQGFIVRRKIWICHYCTFKNAMMSMKCIKCTSIRAPIPKCQFENYVAKWLCYNCGAVVKAHSKCTACLSPHYPDKYGWQCKNCLWIHKDQTKKETISNKNGKILYTVNDKNKCQICRFRKPKHFNWENYRHDAGDLIFGYCREVRNMRDFRFSNIPMYLVDIIKAFYIIKIRNNMAMITRPTEGIYIWNYHITPMEDYRNELGDEYVEIEIGIEEINNNSNKNKVQLQRYCLNELDRKQKKYCPKVKIGDIITMQLDYNDSSLCFGINNDWYGKFTEINANLEYITKLQVYTNRIQIQLKNLIIIPIITNQIKRIVAMADEIDDISTEMIQHALTSNKDEDKDTLILTLLLTLQQMEQESE